MDSPKDSLDTMLARRAIVPPRANFADRIIAAALQRPQMETLSPVVFVKSIFAEFHLPQPAYALAAMLVLGLMLGWQSPINSTNSAVQSVLADDSYDDDSEVSL